MSTAASDELPPFAQPYLADFQQLARMLERIPGFLLQPVEAPSPDLARVFASWLAQQGWNVRLHELRDAEALGNFAAEFSQRSNPIDRAVVIAAQSGALDEAAASFAALNMARDPIAHASPIPLLWWGSAAFMRTTWSHAPDWWSVAATPFRIPLRSLYDLPSHLPFGAFWWTGAVNRDPTRLEEGLLDPQGHSDPAQAARGGLRLAEAQLSRHDHLGAERTLAEIKPNIFEHAKALRSRWHLLAGAVDAAQAPDSGISVVELRSQIAMAQASGTQQREIGLLLQLAKRLESGAMPVPAEALREYVRARQQTAVLGDVAETLNIDAHIVLDLASFTDDALRVELDRYAADATLQTEEPTSRAQAALVRAKLALMSQAFDASEALAQEALRWAQAADDPFLMTGAHCLLAACSYQRGDFSAALARATSFLAGAQAADNLQLQIQARVLMANAHAALGDPRAAARETIELWEILPVFDQQDWIWCGLLNRLASLALQVGDRTMAASFAGSSVEGHIAADRRPDRSWLAIDLKELAAAEPGAAQTLETVFELTDQAEQGLDDSVRARLIKAWQVLDDEVLRLREALEAAGVEAFDPDTWRSQ